jgi:hypothetical protein
MNNDFSVAGLVPDVTDDLSAHRRHFGPPISAKSNSSKNKLFVSLPGCQDCTGVCVDKGACIFFWTTTDCRCVICGAHIGNETICEDLYIAKRRNSSFA